MRLLNVNQLWLEEFPDSALPPYAIFSHTWNSNEVQYEDMSRGSRLYLHPGFAKLEGICSRAASDGHRYVWVDCCCIDRSSSAELTTAINSMYKYYKDSVVCYVLLDDFEVDETSTPRLKGFESCRWYSRGWTLQELLAPSHVEVLDCKWRSIGSRYSLRYRIEKATSIPVDVLCHNTPLSACTVAQKMSWAMGRQTTRGEDIAYCLLGIFDVHMPLLYGEGRQRAFERLQEEIMKRTDDVSLLLWLPHDVPDRDSATVGSLAPSPENFCRRQTCNECGTPFKYGNFRQMNTTDRQHVFSRVSDLPRHQLIRRDFGMVPLSGGRKLQLYCHLLQMPATPDSQRVVLLNVVEDIEASSGACHADCTPKRCKVILFAMHLRESVLTNMNAQYEVIGFQAINLHALPMMRGRVATISIFRNQPSSGPSLSAADVRLRLMSRELWAAESEGKRLMGNIETLYGALSIPISGAEAQSHPSYLTIAYMVAPPGEGRGFCCSLAADWCRRESPSPLRLLFQSLRSAGDSFLSQAQANEFHRLLKHTDRLRIRIGGLCYTARMRPYSPVAIGTQKAVQRERILYALDIRREADQVRRTPEATVHGAFRYGYAVHSQAAFGRGLLQERKAVVRRSFAIEALTCNKRARYQLHGPLPAYYYSGH